MCFPFFSSSELCSEPGKGGYLCFCDVGIGLGKRKKCEELTTYVTL